jgi:hypothetical protein
MLVNDMVSLVYEGKKTTKQVDLILFDFFKDFNKVSHEKVVLKIHDYGSRGQT